MVGLLCFVTEGIHGRSTIFCYRRKGSMVGLLCFATEERDPW
jgi:hypothetical protein